MKFKKDRDNLYILVLDKGEEIISSLINFVKEEKIKSGTIRGIGAVTDVELGYYDINKKEYLRKSFNSYYELISLMGNITYFQEEPIIHCHVIIGENNYNVHGGHLFKATISVTGEIFILTNNINIERKKNDEIGLNLIDL